AGEGGNPNWTNLNATLATTEFVYGVSPDTATPRILGGTQDNGCPGNFGAGGQGAPDPALPTWLGYGSCGDGAFTAIDPTVANNTAYSEAQNLDMTKFTINNNNNVAASPCDSFNNGQCVRGGTPERTPFYAPFAMDPTNASVLFAGTYRMYKTTSGGTPAGVVGWPAASASPDLTLDNTDPLAVVRVAHATTVGTPLVVLTGSNFGKVW